jgi:hypothetical protein
MSTDVNEPPVFHMNKDMGNPGPLMPRNYNGPIATVDNHVILT